MGKLGDILFLFTWLTALPAVSAETPQQLANVLQQWKVECRDSSSCPESVGQVLVTDGKNLGQCTGTLIDENRILTNSHCFNFRDSQTQRLVNPQKLCEAGSRIVFPATGERAAEQMRCKKVLVKSELSLNYINPDFLVFEVENLSGRKSQNLSREGLADQSILKLQRVNPIRRGLGRLTVETCQVVHKTLLVPKAVTDHYHIQIVQGCDVVHGNSGSALVDQNNKIRGVVFKGFTEQARLPMNDFEKDVRQKALAKKTAFVTNSTCMDFSFQQTPDWDIQKCSSYRMLEDSILEALNEDDVEAEYSMDVNFEARQSVVSNSFDSRVVYIKEMRRFFYAPYCIKKSAVMTSESRLRLYVSSWICTPQVGVRDNLTAYPKGLTRDQKTCAITFDPAQFQLYGQGFVQLSGLGCIDSKGQGGPSRTDTWSVCPE